MNNYQKRLHNEEGFSMLIALLTMIILVSIVTSIAFLTVMIVRQTADTRDNSYYSLTAESVANEVTMYANSASIPNPSNPSKKISPITQHVVSSTEAIADGGLDNSNVYHGTNFEFQENGTRYIRYFWYANDLSTTTPFSSYIINIGVYDSATPASSISEVEELDPNAYFMRMNLNSFIASGVEKDEDGNIVYYIPETDFLKRGLFSIGNTDFGAYTRFRSYDSGTTTDPTATGAALSTDSPLGSNGAIGFLYDFTGQQGTWGEIGGRGSLYALAPNDSLDTRCYIESDTVNGGCPLFTNRYEYAVDYALNPTFQEFVDQCVDGTLPSRSWNAETDGSLLTPVTPGDNFLCLDSLTANGTNLELNPVFSTGSPFYVVVKNDVTLGGGTEVHDIISGARGPATLRMYVEGDFTMTSINQTETTTYNGIAIVNGECNFLSPAENLNVRTVLNGAAACQVITTDGAFYYNYDRQLSQLPVIDTLLSQIYRVYEMENLVAVNSLL